MSNSKNLMIMRTAFLAVFLALIFLNIKTIDAAAQLGCFPPCALGQQCVMGQCVGDGGGIPNCDDGNPCTAGQLKVVCLTLCPPPPQPCCSQFCEYTNVNEGQSCDNGNSCEISSCSSGACLVDAIEDDGETCDTGDPCTTGSCLSGACEGSDRCDDGQFCNGVESCSVVFGDFTQCNAGLPPTGSDGVACTDDICNENTDSFDHVPNNSVCNNGQFCDGSEICDATQGCLAGIAPNTNDGVVCTDDSCDEVNDIVLNVANNANCDNGLFCDGSETCDGELGCQAGTAPNPDDGVACTDDSCDEANDDILNVANNANCDNGLFCDGSETCDATQGCQAGTPPIEDDGIDCTLESCDEENDVVFSSVDNLQCDDGQFCNGPEGCIEGVGCQSLNAPPTIDDGVACTDDSCDEVNDVVINAVNDANCDNGLFCDGSETCDATQGCQDGTAPDVDDGVACTDDSCDEDNDSILNVANNANCDNGLFCDGEETCNATEGCQDGTAPDVDDGVACTNDSCDEDNDVVLNAVNDANCDNGLFCDGSETCDATQDCQDGTAPEIDDGVACTDDSCDEDADIVVNAVNDANCDNAIFCDGVETCDASLDCQTDPNPPTGQVCSEEPIGICIDLACVFDGMITITKISEPNNGTDFLFGCSDSSGGACSSIGDEAGMFTLDDEPADTDGVPGSETFTEVLAGVYSVQEMLPPGWEAIDIICENDEDNGTVVDLAMAEAMIDLDPGEDITCTFFNFDAPVTLDDVNGGGDFLILQEQNLISITGATPNKRVFLVWGFQEGLFTVGGNICSGIELGISPPRLLSSFNADQDGNISSPVYIPNLGPALAYLQAVDSGNCDVGEVVALPLID